jgi:hypothetical protein
MKDAPRIEAARHTGGLDWLRKFVPRFESLASEKTFAELIRPMRQISREGNTITVEVPTREALEYVAELLQKFEQGVGIGVRLVLRDDPSVTREPSPVEPKPAPVTPVKSEPRRPIEDPSVLRARLLRQKDWDSEPDPESQRERQNSIEARLA